MLTLFWLVVAIGIVPLAAAIVRLEPGDRHAPSLPPSGSVLLATLAFNLVFFWQEMWLAIPKALTPGLSPILYHNDHDWTGRAPVAELLQGTGAIATMVSGLVCTAILTRARSRSPTVRVFLFWMAFQGLFQSLSQVAIGAVLPGNDVGRALAYLGLGGVARGIVLAAALSALTIAGRALAALVPDSLTGGFAATRADARAFGVSGALLVLLSVPFRIPRDPVEVVLIPAIVTLIGMAWLFLGMTFVARRRSTAKVEAKPVAVRAPAGLLIALLLVFQLVLRPGVPI